jgi:hypothetical protein
VFIEEKRTQKQYKQYSKRYIVAMRDMIILVLYFEGDIKKNDTYDWKPEEVSKHGKVFHFL